MGDIIRYTDLNNKTLDIAGNSTSVNITWDTVVGNASNETASGNGTCKFENPDGEFDSIWYSVILMTVSLCGVVGNLLTLFVLSRNRILGSMDHLERSATYVLVAMACSDLCFCVAQIPEAVIRDDFAWRPPRDFIKMNVQVYSQHVRETFMTSSAWLIVIISVNRFIVVMYPLHARLVINGTKTAAGILGVFFLAVVSTIPQYALHIKVVYCFTDDGEEHVELDFNVPFDVWKRWLLYRVWVWPVIATFVPFVIIAVCNFGLIVMLHSANRQRQQTTSGAHAHNCNKVTLTLLAIVAMYFLLVVPIEVMLYNNIFNAGWGQTVDKIFNILKALNFSSNFLLYVLVNNKFRMTALSLIPCCKTRRDRARSTLRTQLTYDSMSARRATVEKLEKGEQLMLEEIPNNYQEKSRVSV